MTTSGTGGGHSSGYGRSTYSLKSRQSSFTSSKEDLAEKRAAATLTRKNSGIPVYSPIKSECEFFTPTHMVRIFSKFHGVGGTNSDDLSVFRWYSSIGV